MHRTLKLRALLAVAALTTVVAVGASASANAALPVHYGSTALTESINAELYYPTVVPGANNGCKPSSAHPYPVVLVIATLTDEGANWVTLSPLLANAGYCVYTFNYGETDLSDFGRIDALGYIEHSAEELSTFVNKVLSQTKASKVDLVGHSQGGMMPRYYIDFLGGASKVDKLVALAPSNYGTTLDGLTALGETLGLLVPINSVLSTTCEACVQQEVGSSFLATLNAEPTVSSVSYTVIETRDDEVVTPYTNAFLPAGPNVTNITLQNQCPLDGSDHLEIASDPVAMADMLNALDPAQPVKVPCLLVLPVTGPVGPVPSF
jgi:triacylglycerol esterase/lipase EstA (alpha/beta hydrolase family)